ncbi:MAG: hypothetical protein LBO20_02820 [Bifidobacteriaceae bacterium]|jgi:hypothetical protein|nr:hypothetical protein [Bifidobacteriaceae bacterium]
MEYVVTATSPFVNGEARLLIGEAGFTVASRDGAADVFFADVNELAQTDQSVLVRADSGDWVFTRLGRWREPIWQAVSAAYNAAVARSLFVSGAPIVTVDGSYRLVEGDDVASGAATIEIHDDCVVALPPNLDARRVPFAFVDGVGHGEYDLSLRIGADQYSYAKLGYGTEPFRLAVEKQLRAAGERSLTAVRSVDPSLSTSLATVVARHMPFGSAAPLDRLEAVAPSFARALRQAWKESPAGGSFEQFLQLCGLPRIWLGFAATGDGWRAEKNDRAGVWAQLLGGDSLSSAAAPFVPWLVASSPDGGSAAVEFAEDDAATYVYRADGDFPGFAGLVSRALEAVAFSRDAIRLSDQELLQPQYADYRMAAKRTAALRYVRSHFAGRVIHSSPGAWRRRLMELWDTGERWC